MKYIGIIFASFLLGISLYGQHPSLSINTEEVSEIKEGLGRTPIFDKVFERIKSQVDSEIMSGIKVPIPKDMAGGFTHEQHKRNYKTMLNASKLYLFTDDIKYADFVKKMLIEYAEMYSKIGRHPTMKSYATGKIFWQCLNDANWLVYTSQTYDNLYNFFTNDERAYLEKELFIPFSDFLSIENPKFFNRVHNHSTWANAAVGMMALAMDNDSLLQKALYGLKAINFDPNEKDNDGGLMKSEQTKAGFYAQLDYAFTPEGYFTEGPYYQRYAIFPFMMFSQALNNKKPELKIFDYRNGILKKATFALLQLTDSKGRFFPVNDSQKGMTFKAFEVITAVDMIYNLDHRQKSLLNWANLQKTVSFDAAGFKVAKDLINHNNSPISKESLFYGDGVNGDEGGISVLRLDNLDLFFKFSTHGMGHGHYDRLSYSLYDEKDEILQDYGAVRWVNVDQKGGGRYLPENKTFGKQTIAHNTLTINAESQFSGKIEEAEKSSPELYFYDFTDSNFKIISAKEHHAYNEFQQQRTLALFKDDAFNTPIVIDIFNVESSSSATYELAYWFKGHFMASNTDCPKESSTMKKMGDNFGYQHIWKESTCSINAQELVFNWFNQNRFYTITGLASENDKIIRGRAGATDPNYNLRPDPVMIHKKESSNGITFINILESHGKYNRSTEIPQTPYKTIKNIKIKYQDSDYIIFCFSTEDYEWNFYYCFNNSNNNKVHKVSHLNDTFEWKGTHLITKNKI